MPLINVRYRVVRRGEKKVRLAIDKSTSKVKEVKVWKKGKWVAP